MDSGPKRAGMCYNYSSGAYFTKDHASYWGHDNITTVWQVYNGISWQGTNALGNAPYDGGFGPFKAWFHETTGTYSGYDVYIDASATYYQQDHTVSGSLAWMHTGSGAWSCYDGGSWKTTTGFQQEPMNIWFHGYGSDAGWDVYNAAGISYYTHDYTVYWDCSAATNDWSYYNGQGWSHVSGLGATTTAAYNAAPVNQIPADQTFAEDTALVFDSAHGNLISISDTDAGSDPVEVQLAVTNGTLSLSHTTGLTFSHGHGTADNVMDFSGSISNINAALDGMTFNPVSNFNGKAMLQLVTNDLGHTGAGAPKLTTTF